MTGRWLELRGNSRGVAKLEDLPRPKGKGQTHLPFCSARTGLCCRSARCAPKGSQGAGSKIEVRDYNSLKGFRLEIGNGT